MSMPKKILDRCLDTATNSDEVVKRLGENGADRQYEDWMAFLSLLDADRTTWTPAPIRMLLLIIWPSP